MANIQLKIRTLADNDTEINSIKNTGNNVTNGSVKLANSEGFFAKIPTADFAGQELLTFAGGALQFTSNGMLANGSGNVGRLVDESDGKEFIWGVVPEGGEYDVEVQLSVSGLDLTAITLYGDSVAQQYPIEVIVNGETYQNDDVVLTIPVNTNSEQITVKMTKWKRENYNACLTKIAIFAGEIQLENRDIKSLESLSQSTGQPESIFYGCVPSSGSASINDRKGEFYDYIKRGVISNSNSVIDLFVNGKKVQTHIATDSDYDLGGRVFSLDLENKLSLYDNIMYEGYPFDNIQVTLYDLFSSFCSAVDITAEQKTKMLSSEIIYGYNKQIGTVADYFGAITIRYPYIERGTIRETLDKFCTLAQLNLLEDDNGDLIFVQARPIRTGSERVLVIPAKNQMSSIDRNIIVKNNITQAKVSASNIVDEVEFGQLLYTAQIQTSNFWEPAILYKRTVQSNGTKDIFGNVVLGGRAIQLNISNLGYYSGTVVIPKKQAQGLVEIQNLYTGVDANGQPNIKYQLLGRYDYGDVSATANLVDNGDDWPVVADVAEDQISFSSPKYSERFTGNFSTVTATLELAEIPNIAVGCSNSLTFNDYDTNLGTLTYSTNDNGDYVIEYKVFARNKIIKMSGEYYPQSTSMRYRGVFTEVELWSDAVWEGYKEFVPQQLEISFYGDKRVISFEEVDIADDGQSNDNIISISGNEMLQEYPQVSGGKSLARVISDNIVSDYANGVSTCRVTVICGDYKDEYGVVRKNWAKGEILQIGDIVRLDKDNDGTPALTYNDGSTMLWKITGRNLRHEGVPLLDLELQEIF